MDEIQRIQYLSSKISNTKQRKGFETMRLHKVIERTPKTLEDKATVPSLQIKMPQHDNTQRSTSSSPPIDILEDISFNKC
mmetsp:Transcript_17116/g.25795  ORF Transcript_17116/g.25795 Transcript_17116/m.25795 type:complete len:80 (+) Transcript_17116:1008-1247(+)